MLNNLGLFARSFVWLVIFWVVSVFIAFLLPCSPPSHLRNAMVLVAGVASAFAWYGSAIISYHLVKQNIHKDWNMPCQFANMAAAALTGICVILQCVPSWQVCTPAS